VAHDFTGASLGYFSGSYENNSMRLNGQLAADNINKMDGIGNIFFIFNTD